MEDNNEAVEDAQRGSGELHEAKDMEVDNEVDHNNDVAKNSDEIAPKDPEDLPVAAKPDEDITPKAANGGELSSQPAAMLSSEAKPEDDEKRGEESTDEVMENGEEIGGSKVKEVEVVAENGRDEDANGEVALVGREMQPASEVKSLELVVDDRTPSRSFLLDAGDDIADEWGTDEEQAAFMKELEAFHRERGLDFKPPKFYQEPLNCLKLWRSVIRLGGYEQVTSMKLWRQIGEAFRPPKTCTTVSWTFRGFYEKVEPVLVKLFSCPSTLFTDTNVDFEGCIAILMSYNVDYKFFQISSGSSLITMELALLEYEKNKMHRGELPFTDASSSEPASVSQADIQAPGSGRTRRDAAARAMQGWHSQRLLGNGEVGDPVVKDKNPITTPKREKQLRNIGFLKRKGSSPVEHAVKVSRVASKPQLEIVVTDAGVPADWVKVNVQRTKDCYEVYALVPGLLREEVRVQSDPAGRLVISGEPEQQDNPWGVTPFKKVVSLPSRIDPHQTSAVVTLHGQLFVRVPFEQQDI